MKPDPIAYPPRGLNREEAARYVGVTVDSFDELVKVNRMPSARKIGRRLIWDRHQLDAYFAELPTLADNWLDRRLAEGAQFASAKK
jgi:excisionase family DNA binding protein